MEEEIGVKLFGRLPRGVKISAAGNSFLEDARRILQQVNEAALRAGRVARGQSGILRVGSARVSGETAVIGDLSSISDATAKANSTS